MDLPWTEDFVDITGEERLRPHYRTRVKTGWDDGFFYVGAEMEEPQVWGTITEKNAVIFEDNWVWSPQGAVNMHLPSRWGEVEFR